MKTVLIIEDNYEIRENTTEILELSGYKVILAENGREGVCVAVELKPDIILCDIMMPEVDGYEVIRQIKSNSITSAIPFIYVTASAEKSDVKFAMDLGADGYVTKPFEARELMNAMDRCLTK